LAHDWRDGRFAGAESLLFMPASKSSLRRQTPTHHTPIKNPTENEAQETKIKALIRAPSFRIKAVDHKQVRINCLKQAQPYSTDSFRRDLGMGTLFQCSLAAICQQPLKIPSILNIKNQSRQRSTRAARSHSFFPSCLCSTFILAGLCMSCASMSSPKATRFDRHSVRPARRHQQRRTRSPHRMHQARGGFR
jgi:hypothetical protein